MASRIFNYNVRHKFGFIGNSSHKIKMSITEEVKERIDESMDFCYHVTKDGKRVPLVCIICDELVKPCDLCLVSARTIASNREHFGVELFDDLQPDLIRDYSFTSTRKKDKKDLKGLLLSPRGLFVDQLDHRKTGGYTCCQACKACVCSHTMPPFAVSNNYLLGSPPSALLELNDVELALISPVKTYGYCFAYGGGRHKQLSGSLSFFKIEASRIAKAGAHFPALGLNNSILIMLYGGMTEKQKSEARKRTQIRTNKIIDALRWLLKNNNEWMACGKNLQDFTDELKHPILVDGSKEVESSDESVESSHKFSVFFPDGKITTLTGGQESIDDFKALIKDARRHNYDIAFQCDLQKEAVQDFRDNNLSNACLLQFPYGRGGMHEIRMKRDGSLTTNVNIEQYIRHLSLLSQRHMHRDLFVLVLYNMHMKQQMVRTAGMRVREGGTAKMLAQKLTNEDVDFAVLAKTNRIKSPLNAGTRFIKAIDSVVRAVPHSNECTSKARCDAFAHQHAFGMASYFLTVTPDDDNCYLLQVLTQSFVDDDTDIAKLSDEELTARGRERTMLRLRFPGMCAFYFDLALDVIVDEVIGWDRKGGCPNDQKTGLFGSPLAYTIAVEEQGRKTLHAHIQLWVREYNHWRSMLFVNNPAMTSEAEKFISSHVDGRVSTKFFDRKLCQFPKHGSYGAFPHTNCTVELDSRRSPPEVVNDQKLRQLRHSIGHKAMGDMSYTCSHCTRSWSNEEMAESYLKHGVGIKGLTRFPEYDTRRLKSIAVQYQKSRSNTMSGQTKAAINATYNQHFHNKACFYKKPRVLKKVQPGGEVLLKKARKRKRTDQREECRYCIPKRPRRTTGVVDVTEEKQEWYYWNGKADMRHIKEVCLKQEPYDVFHNAHVPAIAFSRMACNTNASPIMPGPICQYQFKYHLKPTQDEDAEEYMRVRSITQRILSKAVDTSEDDGTENRTKALKLVLAGSFAHNTNNVVGGSMASFLTRHGSRFQMSHPTTWCPLRDLDNILQGKNAFTSIAYSAGAPYFRCQALNYLCRPLQLEDMDAYEFFSVFEVVRTAERNKGNQLLFHNGAFEHPSYVEKDNTFREGVRKRHKRHLVKVFHNDFPDTAEFYGNLLDTRTQITEVTERWSQHALLLFLPYRTLGDLLYRGSYTNKLRQAIHSQELNSAAVAFLQNIQDCHYNCYRFTQREDDLQRSTRPYTPGENQLNSLDEEGETEDEADEVDPYIDHFIEQLAKDCKGKDKKPHELKELTFESIKQKGVQRCGYRLLADQDGDREHPLVEMATEKHVPCADEEPDPTANNIPTKEQLVRVLIEETKTRSKHFVHLKVAELADANGSVRSIIDWATNTRLDRRQRRAFEILAGTFVLSMIEDARDGDTQSRQRRRFDKEVTRVRRLVEKGTDSEGKSQLVCLLHGPGGCGKTTVIDLVIEYAREYCSYIEGYVFTSRTIVVTAMTGVAATLLMGETAHSALHLNSTKKVDLDDIDVWRDARMVIVDEISFADKSDIVKICEKLCTLKCKRIPYGGVSIVFSGDFRQLEPVGQCKQPLYKSSCAEFDEYINCYIELNGLHRFNDDLAWGRLLTRFRNGTVTMKDIDYINTRVVASEEDLPRNLRYASFRNRERDAINTALFEKRCRASLKTTGDTTDAIVILSDKLQIRTGGKQWTRFKNSTVFWQSCGEDDVKTDRQKGRMDPVLKLYKGCQVMLTANLSVREGKANGTTATVVRVVLNQGAQSQTIFINGDLPVRCVAASDVSFVELRHTNKRVEPSLFKLTPQEFAFCAKLPKPTILRTKADDRENIRMKATQLPMVSNSATTGHKLQGASVDNIFVHGWDQSRNWIYVMLSRVKTMKGLYMRDPLPRKMSLYAMPQEVTTFIDRLRQHQPHYWDDPQYESLFPEAYRQKP